MPGSRTRRARAVGAELGVVIARFDGARGRGRAVTLAALAIAPLAGVALLVNGAAERLELDTVRTRFELRADPGPDPRIVLVGVSRESLSRLGARWPLDRRLHARAIDVLRRDGARIIGYDVDFVGAGRTPRERRSSTELRPATGGRWVDGRSGTMSAGKVPSEQQLSRSVPVRLGAHRRCQVRRLSYRIGERPEREPKRGPPSAHPNALVRRDLRHRPQPRVASARPIPNSPARSRRSASSRSSTP